MTFYVMLDYEQSAAAEEELEVARTKARHILATEPLPCNVSIYDEDELVEDLGLTCEPNARGYRDVPSN